MAKIFRNVMLALFVSKKNRAAAVAALDKRGAKRPGTKLAATADRSHIIQQALAARREKEHLWNELCDEQKEELMGSLGEGLRTTISAMQEKKKTG